MYHILCMKMDNILGIFHFNFEYIVMVMWNGTNLILGTDFNVLPNVLTSGKPYQGIARNRIYVISIQ